VVADRAVELVFAGLEVDGQRRRVLAGHHLGLLLDAVALDLDRVRELGIVGELVLRSVSCGGIRGRAPPVQDNFAPRMS
jgi:hypothetical protein